MPFWTDGLCPWCLDEEFCTVHLRTGTEGLFSSLDRPWSLGAIDSITSVSVKWCLSEDYTNRSIWISVSVFATGGFVVFALIPSSIFMFIEGLVKTALILSAP